jgi:hypothetical protein
MGKEMSRKNVRLTEESPLGTKCMFHFSLRRLFEIFLFAPMRIRQDKF